MLGFFYLRRIYAPHPGISVSPGRGGLPPFRISRYIRLFRPFPTNPPLSTATYILLFFSIPPSEV